VRIDLRRAVVVQSAEDVSRRLRSIERDPANQILPLPPPPAPFRVPKSPVPPMQLNLGLKHPAVPDMPHDSSPPDLLRGNPRMTGSATAGSPPVDAKFWKRTAELQLTREEIRRVLQRRGWARDEVAILDQRSAETAIVEALSIKRKRIRRLAKERAATEKLMTERAVAPRVDAEKQALKLAGLRNHFLDRDMIQFHDRKVEAAARDLAAMMAVAAYKAFKG